MIAGITLSTCSSVKGPVMDSLKRSHFPKEVQLTQFGVVSRFYSKPARRTLEAQRTP